VVQGPGGNISLKRDGVMWVKASGTWMMEATSRPILIPVDFVAVLDGLAAGTPLAKHVANLSVTIWSARRCGLRSKPRSTPSCRRGWVVHVHCVETISIACLSDATERLAASLTGPELDIRAVRPPGGIAGAERWFEHLRAGTNIVVLGKHGLVVAADSVVEAERLRAEVSRRLARTVRTAPNVDREALRRPQGGGYSSAEDDALHAIATDPISLAAARRGSLYPDHVVFLGPGIIETEGTETAADAARRAGRPDAPMVVVPGAGVLLHSTATSSARALARCLADVVCRLASDDPVNPLSAADEASCSIGTRRNTGSRLTRGCHERSRAGHRCRHLGRAGGGDRSGRRVAAFAASAMPAPRRDGTRITQDPAVGWGWLVGTR